MLVLEEWGVKQEFAMNEEWECGIGGGLFSLLPAQNLFDGLVVCRKEWKSWKFLSGDLTSVCAVM